MKLAQPSDVIFLTSTLVMATLQLQNITVSASLQVIMLFLNCVNAKTKQHESFAYINLPAVTKKL